MRIVELAELTEIDMPRYGSRQFRVGSLGRGLHGTVATVSAGGEIGAHPAVGAQAFVIVQGTARVTGGDDTAEITAGRAALWAPGEEHRTEALSDVVAVILEGPELLTLLR